MSMLPLESIKRIESPLHLRQRIEVSRDAKLISSETTPHTADETLRQLTQLADRFTTKTSNNTPPRQLRKALTHAATYLLETNTPNVTSGELHLIGQASDQSKNKHLLESALDTFEKQPRKKSLDIAHVAMRLALDNNIPFRDALHDIDSISPAVQNIEPSTEEVEQKMSESDKDAYEKLLYKKIEEGGRHINPVPTYKQSARKLYED